MAKNKKQKKDADAPDGGTDGPSTGPAASGDVEWPDGEAPARDTSTGSGSSGVRKGPSAEAVALANTPSGGEAAVKDEAAEEAHTEAAQGAMLRSAGLVGVMTILSRVLGLWRDRLLAGFFGATGVSDAFNLAFILPNLTRRLFGEGALSSAFIPVFSGQLAQGDRKGAFKTASVLLTRLALLLFVLSAVLASGSVAARTFQTLPEDIDLTLRLTEIMIAYCVLINVAAVMMGVLNSLRHFAAPAAAPVLLNVAMIAAMLWFRDLFGTEMSDQITVVAWSVLIGGALQLLIMIPPALARGFKYKPTLDKTDGAYSEVMGNFRHVVLGVALFQVNVLMDQIIARFMIPEDGPLTMLAYGNRLIQLPWAIFSLAVATAALPMLSTFWAKNQKDQFATTVATAVRNTLYLAAPSAVGLCLLSDDLVRLFYGTGAFLADNGEAVARTGRVVFFLSLGLVFYSLNSVLARAIYATKDTRTPARAAGLSVILNLALNLFFVTQTDMKEAGLSLASAISGVFQTLWMARALMRQVGGSGSSRTLSFTATFIASGTVGLIAAAICFSSLSQNENIEGFIVSLATGACAITPLWLACSSYFNLHLKSLRVADAELAEGYRYGVPEKKWPKDLVFFHAIYTITLACGIMGLLVWSVRDSLPPDGRSFVLVFQRGMVPVVVGMFVFAMASQGFQSREYEEIKAAFFNSPSKKG